MARDATWVRGACRQRGHLGGKRERHKGCVSIPALCCRPSWEAAGMRAARLLWVACGAAAKIALYVKGWTRKRGGRLRDGRAGNNKESALSRWCVAWGPYRATRKR